MLTTEIKHRLNTQLKCVMYSFTAFVCCGGGGGSLQASCSASYAQVEQLECDEIR